MSWAKPAENRPPTCTAELHNAQTRSATGRGAQPSTGLVLGLVLGAAVCLACAPRPLAPESAARKYAHALAKGDAASAYAELSPKLAAQLTAKEYARRVGTRPELASAYAADVLASLDDAETSLTIETTCEADLRLSYENGQWKVRPESLDIYSQASPEEALRTLLRAYRARRFDVLARLLVSSSGPLEMRPRSQEELQRAHGAEDTDAVARNLDALALALEDPALEVLGPRARMSYGVGKSIELVLEKGQWKIEDFDL
jgi:hypothetical protein